MLQILTVTETLWVAYSGTENKCSGYDGENEDLKKLKGAESRLWLALAQRLMSATNSPQLFEA